MRNIITILIFAKVLIFANIAFSIDFSNFEEQIFPEVTLFDKNDKEASSNVIKPQVDTPIIDPSDIENELVSKEIDENIGLDNDSIIDEEISIEDDLQDEDVENIIEIDNENKESDN